MCVCVFVIETLKATVLMSVDLMRGFILEFLCLFPMCARACVSVQCLLTVLSVRNVHEI